MQLCESLEELLNVNGELRSEGQAMWTLLGGILGQVPSIPLHPPASPPPDFCICLALLATISCLKSLRKSPLQISALSLIMICDWDESRLQVATHMAHSGVILRSVIALLFVKILSFALTDWPVICHEVRPDCGGKSCLSLLAPMATTSPRCATTGDGSFNECEMQSAEVHCEISILLR